MAFQEVSEGFQVVSGVIRDSGSLQEAQRRSQGRFKGPQKHFRGSQRSSRGVSDALKWTSGTFQGNSEAFQGSQGRFGGLTSYRGFWVS